MHERVSRLIGRAEAEGLVDVAYAETDTPVGRLLVAATPRGLVRVSFHGEAHDEVLGELAERLSPRVLEAPSRLDEVRRELDEYFEGRRHEFHLPLDWSLTGSPFRRAVLERTAKIPYGGTASYRDVASAAGNERAVRAAGTALGANPIPIVVPCHRVLRTGGALGGYGGGLEAKRFLLDLEAGRPTLAPA
ncbi:MAG TPA: methylated-DNA--[protein]-cysteine S-methyltransferase [Gaiellales bacterium]|nr:methylated-DNA--[protein]-cysteine S-methyltransferase [Gaiellales bacterium]